MDNSTFLHRLNDSRGKDNSTLKDHANDSYGIDNITLLERMQEDYTAMYAPIFVYFSLVMIFGIVGNCLSFIYNGFKMKKIPQTALMASPAFIDILNCLECLPHWINMTSIFTYRSTIGCKISFFFLQFLPGISYGILWLISIDRYFMICQQKWKQFTLTSVKIKIAIIVVVLFGLSLPPCFWQGISRITIFDQDDNPLLIHFCTERFDKVNPTSSITYKSVLTVVLVLILLTFVILYSFIGHKQFVSKRRASSDSITTNTSVIPMTLNASETGSRDDNADSNEMPMTSSASEAGSRDNNADSNEMPMPSNVTQAGLKDINAVEHIVNKIANISKKEWQFTLMVFLMTSVMLLALVPLLIFNVMKRLQPLNRVHFSAGSQFMSKTYLVAHATNPYIIAYFNTGFRKFVKQVVWKCNFK